MHHSLKCFNRFKNPFFHELLLNKTVGKNPLPSSIICEVNQLVFIWAWSFGIAKFRIDMMKARCLLQIIIHPTELVRCGDGEIHNWVWLMVVFNLFATCAAHRLQSTTLFYYIDRTHGSGLTAVKNFIVNSLLFKNCTPPSPSSRFLLNKGKRIGKMHLEICNRFSTIAIILES